MGKDKKMAAGEPPVAVEEQIDETTETPVMVPSVEPQNVPRGTQFDIRNVPIENLPRYCSKCDMLQSAYERFAGDSTVYRMEISRHYEEHGIRI